MPAEAKLSASGGMGLRSHRQPVSVPYLKYNKFFAS
jgi:hypothetical protein